MESVDTSDGGELKAVDGRFKGNEKQIQIANQLKDLHELTAEEHFALTLILSAQICKSRSADQSSSEVPLPWGPILQDRNEDGSRAEQRPEPRRHVCRALAIDPAEPFTGVLLRSWAGKKRIQQRSG